MRLAFVHADSFAFEGRRVADRDAAERDLPREGRIDGGVVALVAVEAGDLADPEGVAADAAAELRDVAASLNAERIALYPAAHLVDSPADTADAGDLLRRVAAELAPDHEVLRVPVGYDTAVEVAWKGHPTSEGSRRVTPSTDRDGGGSRWVLALPDGRRLDPGSARSGTDAADLAVLDAVADPHVGDRPTPDYRGILREHGLLSAGALSPRGAFLRDALLAYADGVARSLDAVFVRPSPGVDRSREEVREALDAGDHPAVPVGGDSPTALDPGGIGTLAALSGRTIPDAALPVKRYARNGRVPRRSADGVDWVASPRVTLLVPDLAATREPTRTLLGRMLSVGSDLELDARPVVRVDEAFHDAHPDVVADVVSALDGAVPIEVRAGPGTRLVVELGAVDGGRFRPVAEVSVDPAGAGRFGIELADGGTPAVVSLAPVGDAERTMATLLAAESDRERPHLPAWLSPTQVRLIPVAGNHLDCCERVAATLPPSVRVDVDDRELPVGERIDRATEACVPYVAVVGDREREGSALDVSVRASGRQRRLSPDELAAEVAAAVGDRPSLPRSLPRHVGDRLDAVRE